jgi:hypothetical protein
MTRFLLAGMDPFAEWVVAWREDRQLGQISRKAWLVALSLFISLWCLMGATIAHADPAVICGTGQYFNGYTNNCEGYPGSGLYPQEQHYPGQDQWDRSHRGY